MSVAKPSPAVMHSKLRIHSGRPKSKAAREIEPGSSRAAARDAERARLLRELTPDRIVRVSAPGYQQIGLVAANDEHGVNEIAERLTNDDAM